MNNSIVFLAVLLLGGLCSCKKKPTTEDVLTSNGKGFWDLYVIKQKRAYWTYRFYKDGSCYRYVISRDSSVTLYSSDAILSRKWNIVKDELLFDDIRGKIMRISSDSVYLGNTINTKAFILIKSNKPYTIKY